MMPHYALPAINFEGILSVFFLCLGLFFLFWQKQFIRIILQIDKDKDMDRDKDI